MLSLYTTKLMNEALRLPLDPKLHEVLTLRMSQFSIYEGIDISDLTHFLVIEPGDTEEDIKREVCFSPLENLLDCERYGSPDFMPTWEWIVDHGGIFECVWIVSDDGFGFVLLIIDSEGVDPELLSLCRTYAEKTGA